MFPKKESLNSIFISFPAIWFLFNLIIKFSKIYLLSLESNIIADLALIDWLLKSKTKAKKKYRIRMVPAVLVFKSGSMEKIFKAGLDLTLPVGLAEIQETINEINLASNF